MGRDPQEEPPCETCKPEISEDNKEAFFIYSLVQNQFIMGPAGPVDVNQLAVWEAIDRFKVRNGQDVFKKVLHLSRWMIGRLAEKNESR